VKSVLVTGGSGFIGEYVVEELCLAGYRPLIFDQRRECAKAYPEGVEVFLGDVRDQVSVTESMAHVDGWIHLAAVLGTQETIRNPWPAAMTNIAGGLNVLEAAAQYNLPGVYIAVGNHWMHNTYSITKTAAERFVAMYNKERGTRVNVVRPVNAYGPRQVAAAPFGPSKVRKITPAFVCRALSGLPIEVYGDGRQVSDMLYVTDLAKVLVAALRHAERGEVCDEAVEVGPREHQTVREVAELVNSLVAEHTGSLVGIRHLPMRPGEIPGGRVTANLASLSAIGVEPADFLSLEEGMRRAVKYFAGAEGHTWWKPGTGDGAWT
jgi:UDP-glucose 4-epimerase